MKRINITPEAAADIVKQIDDFEYELTLAKIQNRLNEFLTKWNLTDPDGLMICLFHKRDGYASIFFQDYGDGFIVPDLDRIFYNVSWKDRQVYTYSELEELKESLEILER